MSSQADVKSRQIKVVTGAQDKEEKCVSCGVLSKSGTTFFDTLPVFFCAACTIAGKPREHFREIDAKEGKPNSLSGTCAACKETRAIKMSIDISAENLFFCRACAEKGGEFLAGRSPKCVICQKPADPRYIHQVKFSNLADQPIFMKTTCSMACFAAVTSFASKSQDGHLMILCPVCNKDITKGGLRCARCRAVYYCSKEHQLVHWRQVHKYLCQEVDKVPKVEVATDGEIAKRVVASGLKVAEGGSERKDTPKKDGADP